MDRKKLRIGENYVENYCDGTSVERSFNELLCDDSLAQIFSYLPTLQLIEIEEVCETWKRACQLVWSGIWEFDTRQLYKGRNLSQKNVDMILFRSGRFLRELTIDLDIYYSLNQDKRNNFIRILEGMKLLQSITIDDGNLYLRKNPEYVERVLIALPEKIKKISLSLSCFIHPATYFFSSPLEKFDSLRHLILHGWKLDDVTVNEISKRESLVQLDLKDCTFMGKGEDLKNLVHLEMLELQNVINLDENLIPRIADACNNLRYLNIAQCHNVTEFAIERLAQLEKLAHLDLSSINYTAGNSHSLRNLAKKDLVHLSLNNVAGIESEMIIQIVNQCQKLKYLDIAFCTNASESALQQLSNLENLEHLNLYYVSNINDRVITSIANNCIKMKYINISYCYDVTDHALQKLAQFKNLEFLGINNLGNVNGSVITNVVKNCQSLKILEMNYCSSVLETDLKELGKIKNLERLRLRSISCVTDQTFIGMSMLKSLDCNSCQKVTDVGIIYLLKNCLELAQLNILDTGVTVEAIIHAAQITHDRLNDICLNISVNESIRNTFKSLREEFKYNSQFLIV